MDDYVLAKLLTAIMESLEEEAANRRYTPKKETMDKLLTIRQAIKDDATSAVCSFSRGVNNLEVTLRDYVFNSSFVDLAKIFSIVDAISIDSTLDGVVNIEMLIHNACDWEEE